HVRDRDALATCGLLEPGFQRGEIADQTDHADRRPCARIEADGGGCVVQRIALHDPDAAFIEADQSHVRSFYFAQAVTASDAAAARPEAAPRMRSTKASGSAGVRSSRQATWPSGRTSTSRRS